MSKLSLITLTVSARFCFIKTWCVLLYSARVMYLILCDEHGRQSIHPAKLLIAIHIHYIYIYIGLLYTCVDC